MVTENTTTTNAQDNAGEPRKLERKACGRCGGSGQFSYCQRWGTVCFGCQGSGVVYTKRGRAAKAHLDALLSVPYETLIPGRKVNTIGVTLGGDLYTQWQVVQAVYCELATRTITYETRGIVSGGHKPGDLVRVAGTAAERSAAMAAALAFQDTLNERGLVRKRPARVATPDQVAKREAAKAARAAAKVAAVQAQAQADADRIAAAVAAIQDPATAAKLAAQPHPMGFAGKTLLDYARFILANAGTNKRLAMAERVMAAAAE